MSLHMQPPKSNINDNKSNNVSFNIKPNPNISNAVNIKVPSTHNPLSHRGGIVPTKEKTFRLSNLVESCITEYIKPVDQFDNTDFDPINFINNQFIDEQSISSTDYNSKLKSDNNNIKKIDAIINTCGRQVHILSEDISRRVRESSVQKDSSNRYIIDTRSAIQELVVKIDSIRDRCKVSEDMVVEITKDIKKFDIAKNNATKYYESLKNIQMLTTTLDQLSLLIAKKDYQSIAVIFPEMVSVFQTNFGNYKDAPKVREIGMMIDSSRKEIFQYIYMDFQEYSHERTDAMAKMLQDACIVLDVMGGSFKQDLLDWLIKSMLDRYNTASNPTKDSLLDDAELNKRTSFWSECKKTYREKWSTVFPSAWKVLAIVFKTYCFYTKSHFTKMLSTKIPDVKILSSVLSKTILFEDSQTTALNITKAAGVARDLISTPHVDEVENSVIDNKPTKSAGDLVREKYAYMLKKDNDHKDIKKKEEEPKIVMPQPIITPYINFRGAISACFESHMGAYSEMQLNHVMAMLADAKQTEAWVPEPNEVKEYYMCANKFFSYINSSKTECTRLSTGSLFFDIVGVYKRLLSGFLELLSQHVIATEAKKESLNEMQYVSLMMVANTAAYCVESLPNLQAMIVKSIDEEYKNRVSFESELTNFQILINKSLQIAAARILSYINPIYTQFSNEFNWATYSDAAYECSPFTRRVCEYVSDIVSKTAIYIEAVEYQCFYYNQVAQCVINRFLAALYGSKKIGADGVQLIMIDAKTILDLLESLPMLGFNRPKEVSQLDDLKLERGPNQSDGPRKAPPSYIRYIRNEMAKIDGALKVIGAVKQQIVPAYIKLFSKAPNVNELSRFINLRIDVSPDELKGIILEFGKVTNNPTAIGNATSSVGNMARMFNSAF